MFMEPPAVENRKILASPSSTAVQVEGINDSTSDNEYFANGKDVGQTQLTLKDSSDDDGVFISEINAGKSAFAGNPDSLIDSSDATKHGKRQRYAFRALSRKTLSYQKRQTFTNVCCVTVCPLAMVLLCWVLGFVIQTVIDNQTKVNELIYCANSTQGLNVDNFPIIVNEDSNYKKVSISALPSLPKSKVPFATYNDVYLANYLVSPGTIDLTDAASSFSFSTVPGASCVAHLGPNYRYKTNDPYSLDPDLAAPNMGWSTSSWPNPKLGWLNGTAFVDPAYRGSGGVPLNIYGGVIGTNLTDPNNWQNLFSQAYMAYIGSQSLPWFQIYTATGVNDTLVGGKAQSAPVTSVGGLATTLFNSATASSGIFDTLPNFYYSNLTTQFNGSVYPIPAAIPRFINAPFSSTLGTQLSVSDANEAMDSQLYELITRSYGRLSSLSLSNSSNGLLGLLNFVASSQDIVAQLPYGSILINAIDLVDKLVTMTWQVGSDRRVTSTSAFPTEGYRRIYTEYVTSNSILRTMGAQGGNSKMASSQITPSLRAMPSLQSNRLVINVGSYVGVVLYPYGVSFLLPIFVLILVREKESRILSMMRMNGLSSFTYYSTHFVHFFVLHVIASVIFIIAGAIARLTFFAKTQAGVLIIVFFMWGLVQIVMSFVLGTLFSRSRTALVVSFLLVLGSVLLNTAASQLYSNGNSPDNAYLIWPPFAFYRALVLINIATFSSTRAPYTVAMLKPGDPVFTSIMFMIWQLVLLVLLAFYFDAVIPSEYGVTRKWHFVFSVPYKRAKLWYAKRGVVAHANNSKEAFSVDNLGDVEALPSVSADVTSLEDQDVAQERERVMSIPTGELAKTHPLIIKRVKKVYGGTKTAVKDVTFALESNMVFGLLGPNGAGKSTLISILTGLYPPSGGELTIAGYNVRTEIDQVYQYIGVCPQHDIMWDDLTVEEHLLFYARLKGVDRKHEKELVSSCMTAVSLTKFKSKLSKQLSGGTKRRLSIAMSLVGNPKVVFLDEPTTGLDPEVRRLIWNIIDMAKQDKIIVLTTHSMEEADVLCQRIAIMAKGTLRCIGPSTRLKSLYGDGFRITVQVNSPEDVKGAKSYIAGLLPSNARPVDCFAQTVAYEFKVEPGTLLYQIVDEVEQNKQEHGIQDWGLAEASLEQVFLKLVSQNDAEAVLDSKTTKDSFSSKLKRTTKRFFHRLHAPRPPKDIELCKV